jgi:1-deoxy-D-xylulose-5-phosphate reductoisomerase
MPDRAHRAHPMDSTAAAVRLVVLGSTGSIGTQTLDVARQFPDRIRVVALAAGANDSLLEEQIKEFRPERVALANVDAAERLARRTGISVEAGMEGVRSVARHDPADVVITAMVGAAGLLPTLDAIEMGRRIGLANKETMVVAGDLIREACLRSGAHIIPVDSEHSAIFQCLVGEPADSVQRLILTASGGPFRERPIETFPAITREEALAHPNWEMGPKITVDSATMMNKGLEVIEARWLFDIPPQRLEVVIHPQSIIHSMVEFVDGSSKAQLGPPSMKVPIQYAISAPDRWTADHPRVDWGRSVDLTFSAPDPARYPCLALAWEAMETGGCGGAILNAANEAAVDHFLAGRIGFTRIPTLIRGAMKDLRSGGGASLEDRLLADAQARSWVNRQLGQ